MKRDKIKIQRVPSNKARRIYMVVADHGEGEGVYSVVGPSNERLPIVAIDDDGLLILEGYAQRLASSSKKTVSIICFTRRSHHGTFQPVTTGDKDR